MSRPKSNRALQEFQRNRRRRVAELARQAQEMRLKKAQRKWDSQRDYFPFPVRSVEN